MFWKKKKYETSIGQQIADKMDEFFGIVEGRIQDRDSQIAEMKAAITDYFKVKENKEKKPGWCERMEKAQDRLMKLTK